MRMADKVSLFIVFLLILSVAYYEYRVSVKQIPVTEGEQTEGARYKGITAQQLSRLTNADKDVLIVDLRQRRIYEKGHIPTAISIPFSEFTAKSGEMDKEADTILYCESGPWSRLAYDQLQEKGFKRVRILINGYVGWKWEINGRIEKKG